MKFSAELPDDVFWEVAGIAEKYDLTVPEFLARVGSRLAIFAESVTGDPLKVLDAELRAARRSGWRAPTSGLSVKRTARPVVFTDREMEIALAVMEGKKR